MGVALTGGAAMQGGSSSGDVGADVLAQDGRSADHYPNIDASNNHDACPTIGYIGKDAYPIIDARDQDDYATTLIPWRAHQFREGMVRAPV